MALENGSVAEVTKSQQQRLGTPTLHTSHAIAQALAVGPIFSVVFVAALIAGACGGVAPLTVVIGGIGVIAIGWIITLYARRYFGAGAVYEYLRLGAGARFGLFSALLYYIALLFVGAGGVFIAAGITISQFIASLGGPTIVWWVLGLLWAVIIFALNHRGIRLAANIQLTLSILSAIPLLILAFAIMIQGGASGNTWQAFNPAHTSGSALFAGILFAIELFIGFETAAALGEECENPQRAIGTAVMTVIGISIIFFLIVIYASDIGFGLTNSAKWASNPAPLAALATRYVGKWLATLIDLALIFDTTALALAFSSTAARGWFSLARHRILPAILVKQSKYGTPLGGNVVTLAFAFIFTLFGPVFSIDGMTLFGIMATVGAIVIEVIYVFLGIFAGRILVREKAPWWKWIIVAIGIVTPVLAVYASVWPIPPFPANMSAYISVGIFIVAGIWTSILSAKGTLGEVGKPYEWNETAVSE